MDTQKIKLLELAIYIQTMDLMRAPLEQIDAWTAEPGAVDIGARLSHALGLEAAGGSWEAVPLLTREGYATGAFAPGSLVRWVGMVQDIAEFELLPEAFVDAASGQTYATRFRDTVGAGAGGELQPRSESETLRRRPVYCVPIPALSEWAVAARPRPPRARRPSR